MRRIVLMLVVFSAVVLAGCGAKRNDHVGMWQGKAFSILKSLNPVYTFTEDGRVMETHPGSSHGREGTCKVDYSKDPIQIDLDWGNEGVQTGILRFVGSGKKSMEMVLTYDTRRPSAFGGEGSIFLTKMGK